MMAVSSKLNECLSDIKGNEIYRLLSEIEQEIFTLEKEMKSVKKKLWCMECLVSELHHMLDGSSIPVTEKYRYQLMPLRIRVEKSKNS